MSYKCKIIVNNNYSCLMTDDHNVHKTLWSSLRFRAKNYYHSRLYKQKIWDGFDEFYKKKSGRFLTGLLPEIEYALKFKGWTYFIEDNRIFPKLKYDKIDCNFLKIFKPDTDKILRDYQVELVNGFIEKKRCAITAPTSAGKSLTMFCISQVIGNKTPTLILTNKTSLSAQIYDEFLSYNAQNLGRVYDKFNEPNIITVANVQSLHKIEKLIPHFKALLVDEVHELCSKEACEWYLKMTSCSIRACFSATVFKFGGNDKKQKFTLKGHFGPLLKIKSDMAEDGVLTTKKLQESGSLSKANCTFYPVNEPDLLYDIYQDAIVNGIANNWEFHKIVKRLAETRKGRTLILVDRISHGDQLEKMIQGSYWIKGEDDLETRKQVIEVLKSSKENVITIATQGIFNTGINIFLHNLINAAGGKADHQIIQRFGRGLRTASDKDILEYYDFVFNMNPYLRSHSNKRIKILKKEGHEVVVKDSIDF